MADFELDALNEIDWDAVANTQDEISKFVFAGKYAQYREDLKRRETWDEAVERVEAMHLRKFAHLDPDQIEGIRQAFDLVREKRVGPSMRSMQFGGKAIEAKNERIFNCSVRHVDSIRSFAEIFYLLLCGSGVGLGLTRKYLNRLPNLVNQNDKTGAVITYVIEDTIEGWADSIEALLNCYFVNNAYSGRKIVFDYSKIRPAGTPLKTSGGKAPGHEGLKAAHIKVKALLDNIIEEKLQTRLRTIDAYDIVMHTADAVLSGGVRRSATSVMFSKEDREMINAKTGDWFETNPQRGRSNNSVVLLRDKVTREEFDSIYERTKEWGEPGFVWADHEDVLFNPCFEVSFLPVTEDGVAAVQFCNLTTINGAKMNTEEDYYAAAEAAAIIGTLQASYTNFPYLSNAARELTEAEALLGVSITAMFENPDVLLNPEFQRNAARIVVETNKKWADIIGIKQAARATVIKPEGTSSLAFGTMASGIHGAHAPIMFRRIQANKLDNVYRHFKAHNPLLCEESVWSANKTDDVITFPIRVKEGSIFKGDITALEHLDIIKSTQENWVLSGRAPHSRKDLCHNVSCTIAVQEHEWDDVASYLYENRQFFTAVSLISASGDKAYAQAPNEAVVTAEDAEKFRDYIKSFIPVDYSWMEELEDNTEASQEAACAGPEGCEVKAI